MAFKKRRGVFAVEHIVVCLKHSVKQWWSPFSPKRGMGVR